MDRAPPKDWAPRERKAVVPSKSSAFSTALYEAPPVMVAGQEPRVSGIVELVGGDVKV
jgi:hypothetical protein